jgi:hypothetical protein
VKSDVRVAVVLAAVATAAALLQAQAKSNAVDKPFVSAGKLDLQLDGGAYEIKAAADNHIRVTLGGTTGNAKVDVATNGTHADVKVKDTPHSNFHATVEVPKIADLVVRLTGGELVVGAITGNKDIESYGGNVRITVGDPNEYSSVDTAVKAGDISAPPFGGSKSGLLQTFNWTGHGKYTLRAHLGAGNLELRSK